MCPVLPGISRDISGSRARGEGPTKIIVSAEDRAVKAPRLMAAWMSISIIESVLRSQVSSRIQGEGTSALHHFSLLATEKMQRSAVMRRSQVRDAAAWTVVVGCQRKVERRTDRLGWSGESQVDGDTTYGGS